MKTVSKIISHIKYPAKGLLSLGNRGLLKWIPDEKYIKLMYKWAFNKSINLEEPVSFSEKLQWLKLNNRRKEYTSYVDKYEVRKYVSSLIGEDHLIPLIGVWDKSTEINFDDLPEQFVLKCTHDSGSACIVKAKSTTNISKAKKTLDKAMRRNFYWAGREWPYKNVKPRIVAEKLMKDNNSKDLKDYKYFCFNGEPKMLFIASERGIADEPKFDFFDMEFKHIAVRNGHPNADYTIPKPKCFDEMKKFAEILSAGIPHVRVDFYEINGKVYFGEMTFFHFGGFVPFEPEYYDELMGSWISLPTATK